ncbi:DNA polymerase III subunit gamma/tau [Microbacterium aurum]|uniref:DNA polymerase III subunit gamma/tau n=1 Tax=Microbacterium aurum TaxID=36805 RepID=UPI001EF462FF|nr:DNA polymerase III subunit gamma/tau [Microbacterium aurum]MCG7414113.1 DNA polymerase III subunit gamma/tau [Microbacterium aurum]
MSTGRDDDALSWDGDDDPTLDVGTRPAPDPEPAAEPLALPDGYTAVGRGSDEVGRIDANGTVTMPGEPAPLGNVMLVSLGILGGIYALFTIGWIIGGLRLEGTAQFLVSPVGYRFAFWLAVIAPALWFATVYLLTRLSKPWLRLVWLIGGLALLVPWPFVMIGAVGQ